MSDESKRTPAEEARAKAQAVVDSWITRGDMHSDEMVADLTPVFERAQFADPSVLGGLRLALMDAEKLADEQRDRAERAEANVKMAWAEVAAAIAERDEARRERDSAQQARRDISDLCTKANASTLEAIKQRDDLRDDLARLRVREGQLAAACRQLRDEHMQAYAGADIALHTVGTSMADKALSSPPDVPKQACGEVHPECVYHPEGHLSPDTPDMRAVRIVPGSEVPHGPHRNPCLGDLAPDVLDKK